MLPIQNIAFYAFFKPTFKLEETKEVLRCRMAELQIKGTILLALEGVNCSLSGPTEKMAVFLTFLLETINVHSPELKISYSMGVAFKRSLVKIKEYIVAQPGVTPITVKESSAPYISPADFHQWLQESKSMVILDTRNDFEYEAGRFKGAFHLGGRHFSDFETSLKEFPQAWLDMPVVTFCTGGIRCEKAAPLMRKRGFREVYQLQGGILNYFQKIGRGFFEGECFVFDERVALDEKLCSSYEQKEPQ